MTERGTSLSRAILPPAEGEIKPLSAYNTLMPEPLRRFVLLRHESSETGHWDLMLDTGDALATWQLLDDPHALGSGAPAAPLRARRLRDHRRAYLDHEGPVSRHRGQVTRVDGGEYAMLAQEPDSWTVRLAGSLLNGTFRLVAGEGPDELWELHYLAP